MSLFRKDLHPASAAQCDGPWSGSKGGLRFRCKICGHRFKIGDLFRLVYANGADSPTRTGNFVVCGDCNEDDSALLLKMAKIEEEAFSRFFWLVEDDNYLRRWSESDS